MKKIIITIFLCCFISFGLTGCDNRKNEFEIGNESNIEITEKNISLSVKQNTLTKTGAILILKNDSDMDISYGEPYEIEIKKDGKWHKINVSLNFIMPAWKLKAKETKEIELNWEHSYGKLARGEYRIIKNIYVKNSTGTFDNHYVSAEFKIK